MVYKHRHENPPLEHCQILWIWDNWEVIRTQTVRSNGGWRGEITVGFYYSDGILYQARKPDLVIIDRKKDQCFIIDIAVPGNWQISRPEERSSEAVKHYENSCSSCDWRSHRESKKHLKIIGLYTKKEFLQNAALLGTARYLRKVPKAWGYETWLALSTTFSIRSKIHLSCVNLDVIITTTITIITMMMTL